MSDSQDVKGPQLSLLEEDQMVTVKGQTFPPTSRFSSVSGCLGYRLTLLILQMLSFIILTGLLVAVLNQGFKFLSSQNQSEQKFYQELTQLKTAMDSLCRPCPWDWMYFQEDCYFFSKSKRNWENSIKACLEMGAQLVVIETDEEQSFLQQTLKNKGQTWIGLSDLNEEATWRWVNGLPLSQGFKQYWNKGEPNNVGEEDCVEFTGDGWNDAKCNSANLWICKKPSSTCSSSSLTKKL